MSVEVNVLSLESCPRDSKGGPLVCYGCAHSRSDMEFPGGPSGERPCHFCVRNRYREQWIAKFKLENPDTKMNVECWYDGTPPIKIPIDCYHSCDMVEQSVRKTPLEFTTNDERRIRLKKK